MNEMICEWPWDDSCFADATHTFQSERQPIATGFKFTFKVNLCNHHLSQELSGLFVEGDQKITISPL